MIVVDQDDPLPPFEQIRTQLADRIRAGQLTEGQRLPSIRQLASDLRLAPGTVARAYGELEAAGLVESSRVGGTRVRAGQAADAALRDAAREFVAVARRHGMSLPEVLGAIRAEWSGTEPGPAAVPRSGPRPASVPGVEGGG
ncbi:GntR family transcriptional regulator [Saccharomonospora piscinae]|uniref:GntR family transcriptional regulator n=1 Tax=Saccharomonospora piscinae TaxID=687388 RepID=UPI0011058404|nr:GntR family transcriptional regulator [Saccharomonospora piscinae]TLW92067.1 GntR family transcriptional regulator [Saccharomonospora piscinae]